LIHGFVFLHVFLSEEDAYAGLAFFLFALQVLDEFLESELDNVLSRGIASSKKLLLVQAETFPCAWVEEKLKVVVKELTLKVASIDETCSLGVKRLIDVHNGQLPICEVITNGHEYVFDHFLSSLCRAVLR